MLNVYKIFNCVHNNNITIMQVEKKQKKLFSGVNNNACKQYAE